ncbi:MAG: hypothetical protein ACRENE_19315, partial [Polyangiaceae bacterium]
MTARGSLFTGTLAAALAAVGPAGAGGVAAAPDAAAAPAAGNAVDTGATLPDEDLARMLAALGTGSIDERRAAAGAVCGLGPEAVDTIARELTALRRAS